MIQFHKKVAVNLMLLAASVGLLAIVLFLPDFAEEYAAALGMTFAFAIGIIAYLACRWLRCPYCRRLLLVKIFVMNQSVFPCPHCGTQVEVG
ncbi:MAG: hypothetical protein HFF18_09175 [Oscillospiraceae bacterium]|nr:hypothetical protein [Oscillospiraceae bacterium]